MKRSVLILLAVLMLAVPAAEAGTYKVHSCRAADGAPAPVDGWRAFRTTYSSWTSDSCLTGGTLSASLDGSVAHTPNQSLVGWEFDSGGREIAAWSAQLITDNAQSWHGASTDVWAARPDRAFTGDNLAFLCSSTHGCTGRRTHTIGETRTPANTRSLHLTAMCGGVSGFQCAPVARSTTTEFTLLRATFTLVDDTAPTAAAHAAGDLNFTATDPMPGSGLSRAELEVDGKVVQVRALGDASRCPVNGSDFVHRQPCPAKAEVEFETPPLAPGAHTLRARVFDAAGNAATGAGPLKIDVPGPIDPDPINSTATTPAPATSRAKPTRRVQLRALRQRIKPYGRMLLSGRIRAGRLQRGALVEIQLRSGRGWRTIAVRRTNSTGMFRFRYRFRRTAHARLAFRARVRPDNELPVKPLPSRTVRVRVGRG